MRHGQRVEANAGTPIYDPVKTIAHIPLAIYVTLTPGDGAVGDDRLRTLTGLRALIPPAEASLDTLRLSAATLARQKRIVAASLAFLDDVAGRRKFARSSLLAFTRRMAPLVMENVTEATRAQLDATHALVSAWRRDLTAEEWNQLHVVIIGPHMPRENLVVTQYFLRLLHEPGEGRRVVYAESLWEETAGSRSPRHPPARRQCRRGILWRLHAHAPRPAGRRRQPVPASPVAEIDDAWDNISL